MAAIDAKMADLFFRYILPLAAAFIGFRIILYFARKFYPDVYAFLVTKYTEKHHKLIKEQKDKLFSDMVSLCQENQRFYLLEIGSGPGRNFELYPENTSFTAVEPNKSFQKYIAQNATKVPKLEVANFLTIGAEDMREHVKDASQDAVVSTLTMCSVRDVEAVMTEVLRVLKPGGRFYFIEHTRAHAQNSWTHLLQRVFAPLVRYVAGCNIDRTPWAAIDRAGFSQVKYTKNEIKEIMIICRPHLFGYAVK